MNYQAFTHQDDSKSLLPNHGRFSSLVFNYNFNNMINDIEYNDY